MRTFKIFCLLLPLIILAADLWYSVITNLITLINHIPNAPSKAQMGDIPIAPDIAISGLQVTMNFGMATIITFGFGCLALLYKRQNFNQEIKFGIFKVLGFLIVFAFSLPALWGFLWQLIHLVTQGQWHGANPDIRYLTIALLLPYPGLLLASCLLKHRKNKRTNTVTV